MNENEALMSKALQLKGRMISIVNEGLTLISDMQSTNEVFVNTLTQVWTTEQLLEMQSSLTIITQALESIQTQCPHLSLVIFPQEEQS